MSQSILITGGTGLVGTRLTEILLEKGYSVSHLSRTRQDKQNVRAYTWDIDKKEIEPEALAGADYVVHLAGAGVGEKRWTESRKETILKSRTQSTRLLHDTISQLGNHHIKGFISASGISIYGEDTGSREITEENPKGSGFLAEATKQWETAVDEISRLNIRVVKLRTGVALSEKGGALPQMTWPVRLGIGSPLGSGKQYMSWIHLDDLCRMYLYAIENEQMAGVYNAVGPNPVTNEVLIRSAAKALNRPVFFPNVPAFAIKLLFGEMATVVLGGSKVSSRKIEEEGFAFRFSSLEAALLDLLK